MAKKEAAKTEEQVAAEVAAEFVKLKDRDEKFEGFVRKRFRDDVDVLKNVWSRPEKYADKLKETIDGYKKMKEVMKTYIKWFRALVPNEFGGDDHINFAEANNEEDWLEDVLETACVNILRKEDGADILEDLKNKCDAYIAAEKEVKTAKAALEKTRGVMTGRDLQHLEADMTALHDEVHTGKLSAAKNWLLRKIPYFGREAKAEHQRIEGLLKDAQEEHGVGTKEEVAIHRKAVADLVKNIDLLKEQRKEIVKHLDAAGDIHQEIAGKAMAIMHRMTSSGTERGALAAVEMLRGLRTHIHGGEHHLVRMTGRSDAASIADSRIELFARERVVHILDNLKKGSEEDAAEALDDILGDDKTKGTKRMMWELITERTKNETDIDKGIAFADLQRRMRPKLRPDKA